jgi:endonuclease/exonuclease/phosphatase family metal-dependent hydrolase
MRGTETPRSVTRLLIAACLVSTIVAPVAAESPSTIRVVSLNILHGGAFSGWTGNDEHLEVRLDLVTEALQALAPDIIAIQEASTSRRRGDVASRLAGRLGMNHVYAPATMRLFDADWANRQAVAFMDFAEGPAILSRFPIVYSEVHKLPRCGRWFDPRVLVFAELATPGGLLPVFSTHISGHACHAQAVAEVVRFHKGDLPGILMGDFNAVESSPAISTLVSEIGGVDVFRAVHPDAAGFTVWQPVTEPERRALRRVDYVFLVPGRAFSGAAVASRVVVDSPAQRPDGSWLWPSDHYGVLADLAVFPSSAGHAADAADHDAPAQDPDDGRPDH